MELKIKDVLIYVRAIRQSIRCNIPYLTNALQIALAEFLNKNGGLKNG